MKKFSPVMLVLAAAVHANCVHAYDAELIEYFGDSSNFTKRELNINFKMNDYDLNGDTQASMSIPYTTDPLVAAGVLPPEMAGQPTIYNADIDLETNIEEMGASLWINYKSGWLADHFGYEIGVQGALPNIHQHGYLALEASPSWMGNPMPKQAMTVRDFGYYYELDDRDHMVGKLGNANIRFRVGDDANHAQLIVGRFTPTMYNLLHRPDVLYRAFEEVYEGVSLTGRFEWEWGMMMPWANYFTGFSDQNRQETVHFDDLKDNVGYGSYDEIYNIGFHTVTDYFKSSASFSIAPDFQTNGIIEAYSGIPLSWLGLASSTQDKTHYIKYMLKYGFEDGHGTLNDSHSTDVFEYGIGLQYGNLEFLAGQTFIGDESYRGFTIQDGKDPSKKAGGGVAIWPDVATLNSFNYAGQTTTYLVGSYKLDGWGLEGYKISGIIASARDTDLDTFAKENIAMNNPTRILSVTDKDYTETNIDISYNYFEGTGFGWRLLTGLDTNLGVSGLGYFIVYRGDVFEALND